MAVRLLIAYDGSAPAEAAVVTAGGLFAGARGFLLTVIDPRIRLGRARPGVRPSRLSGPPGGWP